MEKSSDEMVEMGNRPPLKRPRQVVSNQSGASSETPVAPKDLSEYTDTDWPGAFVKAITSVSDSDEIRTLAATGLLFFEAYLRPGVMSKIRKILRQEERCGGGYAKPISSGASSETPPKNLSDDASWVDLIVKEITSASDSDDARIRATKALESFEESLFTLLMSEMRHNLQQASGYARSDLLGLDDSSQDDEDDMPYESSPKMEMEMEKKKMNCSVDGALVSNQSGEDTVLVDLIVKEITSASDLDDARIRVIRAFESLKAPMISEKKQNLQKERRRCGRARPFSFGMDDSEEDENDMRYESPPMQE